VDPLFDLFTYRRHCNIGKFSGDFCLDFSSKKFSQQTLQYLHFEPGGS
jgi:hypothetical protein